MNTKNLRLSPPHRVFVCMILSILAHLAVCQEVRSINGIGNNEGNPVFGAVNDVQVRLSPATYNDGIGEPLTTENSTRPNARVVSNELFAQDDVVADRLNLSDFTWVFGQFIDHDITLVHNNAAESLDIEVPADDLTFTPGTSIPMSRNAVVSGTGTEEGNPREYQNAITAFIDGSTVYGSTDEVANWLRTFEDGKLKVSSNEMLPWNTKDLSFNDVVDAEAPQMDNNGGQLTKFYIAGDERANENPLLLAMHTLFVREHNRQCDIEKQAHPGWNDERLYQSARRIVIAEIQNIVYYEWLPALGLKLAPYSGYKDNIAPRTFNEFSAAAFRMGHTLINSDIIRMTNEGNEVSGGNIQLRDAFFNPSVVNLAGGVDPYLKGMATQVQQDFDCKVIDDVRNFLFGAPGQGGLDLAAININRGRDRGLGNYNELRRQLGLPIFTSFEQLTDSPEDAATMEAIYNDIDNLDAWVGMLAENRAEGALFGQVVSVIMERQFQILRDGDRFYFENDQFTADELAAIRKVTMRDIIMNNSSIKLMQDEVFRAMPHDNIELGPTLIPFALDAAIYPNPIGESLNIKVYGDVEEGLTVTVMDYLGQVILKEGTTLYQGTNYLSIPLVECPRGYYNVLLETDRRFKILKMIKE